MKRLIKPIHKTYNPHTKLFALLILYVSGIGIYYVLRYGGQWIEIDTARLTYSAQNVLNEATLIPSRHAYRFGYAYPALANWLARLSGLSVPLLQTAFLPIIGVITGAVIALMFYRASLGMGAVSILATLLLFLQADFLFVTMRGSHEKLTWLLAMLALFILARSTKKQQDLKSLALHVVLFYLAIYGLIASSVFFSSSLITAILLAFVLGMIINHWLREKKRGDEPGRLQRLALISASAMVLLYTFIFHIYIPAQSSLHELPSILDKIAALFLGFEALANPYNYINVGWAYPWAYPALSAYTWLLLLGSLAEWLYQGYHLLRGAKFSLSEWLPWLLYAGFAAQVAAAIVIDFAGVLSSNLQLRLLPGLVVFAAMMVAQAINRLLGSVESRYRRLLTVPTALLVMWFSLASMMKASNDPMLSNKWSFYDHTELAVLEWSDEHLKNQLIWTGSDERLNALYQAMSESYMVSDNYFVNDKELVYYPDYTTSYTLLSEIERLRRARTGKALPEVDFENQVYDNGGAQLYHRRPRTPYQR